MSKGRPLPKPSTIELAAAAFRSEHANGQLGALDIEAILEMRLGIEIIPVPGLCSSTKSKGFITADGKTICVDDHIFRHQPEERRQVLTHEAAHLILHGAVLPSVAFKSVADCRAFHASLSTARLACIEYEATEFASHVLMPRGQVAAAFNNAVDEFVEVFAFLDADLANNDRQKLWEVFKLYVAAAVADRFGVTESWAMRRLHANGLFRGFRLGQSIAHARRALVQGMEATPIA